jgi:hypothetical protein
MTYFLRALASRPQAKYGNIYLKKIIHYYGRVDSYIIQTFKEQYHLLLH